MSRPGVWLNVHHRIEPGGSPVSRGGCRNRVRFNVLRSPAVAAASANKGPDARAGAVPLLGAASQGRPQRRLSAHRHVREQWQRETVELHRRLWRRNELLDRDRDAAASKRFSTEEPLWAWA